MKPKGDVLEKPTKWTVRSGETMFSGPYEVPAGKSVREVVIAAWTRDMAQRPDPPQWEEAERTILPDIARAAGGLRAAVRFAMEDVGVPLSDPDIDLILGQNCVWLNFDGKDQMRAKLIRAAFLLAQARWSEEGYATGDVLCTWGADGSGVQLGVEEVP